MNAFAGYTAMMLRRACISFCFTLVALVLTLGVLMVPDVVLAAGAGIPSRGIPSSYRAVLQHTAKTQGTVRASNNDRWRCSGNRCEGIFVRQFGVPACQALARTQGSVASFTSYDAARRRSLRLNAVQLRQCNGGSGQQQGAPVVRGRIPRVGVHVGIPVPDTVRAGQLILVGKPQVPDTVRTGVLVLVGKPQAQAAPDTIRTGALILVGKPHIQAIPDTVRTGALVLVGKPQVPDTIRTGQLVLVGKPQQSVPDTVRTGTLILVGKKR